MLQLDYQTSGQTEFTIDLSDVSTVYGGERNGFFLWYVNGSKTACFFLDEKNPDTDELRLRLEQLEDVSLVVKPGKPVVLYDFNSKSNTRHYGKVEIRD